MSMLCYQCEQTAKGQGCTTSGVCGKSPEIAALQDLLVYAVKDISRYAHRAAQLGVTDRDVNIFTTKALFSTLTNVNFDVQRFQEFLKQAADIKQKAKKLYESASTQAGQEVEVLKESLDWEGKVGDIDRLVGMGTDISIQKRIDKLGEDVTGLQELIMR